MKICPNCQEKSSGTFCAKCGCKMMGVMQRKTKILIIAIAASVISVSISVALLMTLVVTPSRNYDNAVQLFIDGRYTDAFAALDALPTGYKDVAELHPYYGAYAAFERGEYETAALAFGTCGSYMNAAAMVLECYYLYAHILMSGNEFDEASRVLSLLEGYKDSPDMMLEAQYRQAVSLMQTDSAAAKAIFLTLGDYIDSDDMLKDCDYYAAVKFLDAGQYLAAVNVFTMLGDHRDSEDMVFEAWYRNGIDLLASEDFSGALERFETIGEYRNSMEMMLETRYLWGLSLLDSGKYADAYTQFSRAGEYKDSATMILEVRYRYGMELFNDGDYVEAAIRFHAVSDYKNAAAMLSESRYLEAMRLFNDEDYSAARRLFILLEDYKDSAEMAVTARANDKAADYMELYDILQEAVDRHGYGRSSLNRNGSTIYHGILHAELIDFDNDGFPELLYIYGDGTLTDGAICEIYGYSGGRILYGSHGIHYMAGASIGTNRSGISYFIHWENQSVSLDEMYYTISNGRYSQVLTRSNGFDMDISINTGEETWKYSVNGSQVDRQTFTNAQEVQLGITRTRALEYSAEGSADRVNAALAAIEALAAAQ